MKIRSQDGSGIYEFGSVFIPEMGPDNVIRIKGQSEQHSYFLGRYEDGARARGVLVDIETAYCKGIKIFYIPVK